jgi:putative membrane protein
MHKLLIPSLTLLLTLNMSAVQAQTLPPSNANIFEILEVANKGEIKAGKEAKSSATSNEVKQFAEQMINDHTEMAKSSKALAKKLNIHPEENATSKALEADAKNTLKGIKDLKGAEFDKAYIASQVSMHQKVLDMINNTLLPNAQNPELKAMLTEATPKIQAHLEHAKNMHSKMQ